MRKLKQKVLRLNGTLNFFEEKLFSRKEIRYLKSNKIKDEKIHFKVPKIFSFIENPDEAFDFIKNIFKCRYEEKEILIDISQCEEIGMCALFIFDYILLMILDEKEQNQTIWYVFSKDENINKFFIDAGISGYIDNDSDSFKKKREQLKEIKLKLLKTKMGNNGETNKLIRLLLKTQKIDSIINLEQTIREFLDDCLNDFGYRLNELGERVIEKIVSEWISNCKNHLKSFCEYYCTGSLNYEKENGNCNLVLVNFGDTIPESINKEDTTEIGKRTFNSITSLQKYSKNFTKNNGIVLAAIQKKVSRLKTETNTRGTGFPEIMSFFSQLSDDEENSKMTIISGKTQIKFTKSDFKRYNKDRNIFFNESCNPSEKPNRRNMINMKNKFPGTLISIKFVFKKDYIEKLNI